MYMHDYVFIGYINVFVYVDSGEDHESVSRVGALSRSNYLRSPSRLESCGLIFKSAGAILITYIFLSFYYLFVYNI